MFKLTLGVFAIKLMLFSAHVQAHGKLCSWYMPSHLALTFEGHRHLLRKTFANVFPLKAWSGDDGGKAMIAIRQVM